ncbi:terminase small subunit [Scandinavium manionii]|uniref:terminase small subunit n=1 Tax=Scandinavium manionii TaxID=2926520 RepID=UPI0021663BCB|nr:terminase small subunit [Scandinavium manionii]MCS2168035.1 terminase small subunit [Scandinavium manionii]
MKHLLNKKTMAKSCNICMTAFDKWGIEPIERRGREAFYDVASVIKNRVDNEISKLLDTSGGIDDEELLKERIRLTRAQADAQELKNEKERNEVISVDFMRFALVRISNEVASILDTIPLSVQRKSQAMDIRGVNIIRQEITKARNIAAGLGEKLPALIDEYSNLQEQ